MLFGMTGLWRFYSAAFLIFLSLDGEFMVAVGLSLIVGS
jgi:hypothetical protein